MIMKYWFYQSFWLLLFWEIWMPFDFSPAAHLIKKKTLYRFAALYEIHVGKPDKLATLVGRRRWLGVSAEWLSFFVLTKENETEQDECREHQQLAADEHNVLRHTLHYITSLFWPHLSVKPPARVLQIKIHIMTSGTPYLCFTGKLHGHMIQVVFTFIHVLKFSYSLFETH